MVTGGMSLQAYIDGQTISLRQWSGKPYCSPQEHIADVRIRVIDLCLCRHGKGMISNTIHSSTAAIAENDGLTHELFCEWFGKLPLHVSVPVQMLIWNQDGPFYVSDLYIDSFAKPK